MARGRSRPLATRPVAVAALKARLSGDNAELWMPAQLWILALAMIALEVGRRPQPVLKDTSREVRKAMISPNGPLQADADSRPRNCLSF